MDDDDDRPCGRLGAHAPHAWLTRADLRCAGAGGPGRTAPPLPDEDATDQE